MNLRDLMYLISVYDEGSFSKAADACFVSQPTLSGQLKKLEEELGITLIERTTRHILFTPLGEQVVEYARNAIASVKDIQDLAEASNSFGIAKLRLGAIPTVGPYLLPQLMPKLMKDLSQVEWYLHEALTEVLLEKVANGDLDAAILAKMDWQDDWYEQEICRESMFLAVSKEHELAKNEAVPLSVLADENVIMLEDGHCLRDHTAGHCFVAGAEEDKRFRATSIDTLLHMVGTGIGSTLVPESITKWRWSGVRFIPLEENPSPSRDIVLITRKSSPYTAILEKVSLLCKQAYGDMGLVTI